MDVDKETSGNNSDINTNSPANSVAGAISDEDMDQVSNQDIEL